MGPKKTLANDKNNIALYILLFVTAILLVYPPFYRGLFFDMELLFYNVLSFLFFGIFLVYNLATRKEKLLQSPVDFILLAFCFIYLINIFGAVTPREAVLELFKVANYFMIYLIVSRLPTQKTIQWLMYALVVAAVGVSFVGLGAGFETFEYPGAMGRWGRRIFTSLQYPNTAASFLTAGFFVALSRVMDEKQSFIKSIFGGAAHFILITFVFTMSRGAWLFFPVVLLLFWVLNFRRFINAFIYALIPGIVFLITAIPIWDAIQEDVAVGWLYVVLGTLASMALTFVFSYFFEGIGKLNNKSVHYGFIGILAVIILSVSIYGATNYEKAMDYMPEQVQSRVEAIDFRETGLGTRGELMETAWAMIKDSPILGAGGGGWEPLYHRYMERDYWATEVHSHIFQVGVETGIPGMLIFSAIWVGLIYQFYMIWRKKPENYYPASGIFVAAFALGGHSMIDFNLSLPAVAVYLWALFGLLTFYYNDAVGNRVGDIDESVSKKTASKKKPKKSRKKQGIFSGETRLEVVNNIAPYVMLLVTAIMLFYSTMVYFGYRDGRHGAAALQEGELDVAISSLERAITRDTLNSDFHFDLAMVYEGMYQHTGEMQYLEKAVETAEQGYELNPESGAVHRELGELLIRANQIDRGLELLERGTQVQPYYKDGYLLYAEALLNLGENSLQDGNVEEGTDYLEEVIEFRDVFLEHKDQTDEFDSFIFKAYVLLEEYERALDFKEYIELSRSGDKLPYMAIMYHELEDDESYEEVRAEMEEDEDDHEEYQEQYQELQELLD
ncbi:O-antigen ligase family protein [Natranaerobius thermophilus]|uniref:O-antigen polymerase n=1 Tax=Natranaerobius thermophilus (strain ATCC BAA-1301 / DSM 18059 / JW/NM-WN-LF) TaxID=457570 RepID=B2A1C6_NATTJ|nr:O-antigen ligase family protein [Natranaerobius thermophilus]ACB86064.1 O-antigen polymerase [Natranaerobius thermophilus JW/NM-WN-LF]